MDLHASWSRRVAAVAVTVTTVLAPAPALAAPAANAAPASVTAHAPVPAGFKAAALSWLNPRQGWVLGAVPCGAKLCWRVAATYDGARTWRGLGQVGPATAPPPDARPPVSEIRFATAEVGWAFGPGLFRSTNGGRAWRQVAIPGGGKQVLALVISPAAAFAVISPCVGTDSGCTKSPTLWRTGAATSADWNLVRLKMPRAYFASMSTFDRTVYVVDGDNTPTAMGTLYASVDGHSFSARPSPCELSKSLGLAQVVATSANRVALLCTGDPGFSKAVKTVYLSRDTGFSDVYAGMTGPLGISAELAASTSGELAVAAWSDGSFIYHGTGPAKPWPMVLGLADDGMGFNDLAFVSSQVAWAVHGPVSVLADFAGDLCVTRDGGVRWTIVKL